MTRPGAIILPNYVAPLLGVAFLVYATLSLTWAKAEPYQAVGQLAILTGAFVVGYWLKSLRWIWLGMMALSMVAVCVSLWGVYVEHVMEFINPNIVGGLVALSLAAAISYHYWWYLPLALGSLWHLQSRGAWAAAAIAFVVGLWHSYKATGWLIAIAAIGLASQAEKVSANESLWRRMGVWQDTLNHLTFWGSGWGSFAQAYVDFGRKTNMTMLLAPHAYNDILEILFELGIGSIFLWALVMVCLEGRNWTDRLVLLTFFVLSLGYFPFAYLGPLVALSLGHLSQTKDENPWLAGG